MIGLILAAIAVIWLIFSSLTDIKFREVPDWVSYSLVVIGLGVRLLYSIMNDELSFFLYGLGGFVIFLVLGYVMYYGKQWGGGDAKLLMGLGATFGNYPLDLFNYFSPHINTYFILILLMNIVIIGGIYGFFLGLYLAVINWSKFSLQVKKLRRERLYKNRRNITISIVLMAVLVSFLLDNFSYRIMIYALSLIVIVLNYLLLCLKAIEDVCMYKYINVGRLTEGDWIAEDVFFKGKKVYKVERLGITKENILKLKNIGIKNILVKEGFPFVPAFLIAFLLSLIYGSFIIL